VDLVKVDLRGDAPKFAPSERRLMVYWVPENLVAAAVWDFCRVLTEGGVHPGHRSSCVSLPQIADVPDGAVLEAVRHSWERRCFGFLFSHPSFGAVPDGEELPCRAAVLLYRTVTLPAMTGRDMEDGH
jgi:hypothetical protein